MPLGGGVPLPPVPAAVAGASAMQLVPGQMQQQAQLQAQQSAQVLAQMMSAFSSLPNAAAQAAQSEPSAQVTPNSGVPAADPSDPYGGS